jgi:hypothetical protein
MYGQWWHPLLAQAAFLLWAKTVGQLGDKPLENYEEEDECDVDAEEGEVAGETLGPADLDLDDDVEAINPR